MVCTFLKWISFFNHFEFTFNTENMNVVIPSPSLLSKYAGSQLRAGFCNKLIFYTLTYLGTKYICRMRYIIFKIADLYFMRSSLNFIFCNNKFWFDSCQLSSLQFLSFVDGSLLPIEIMKLLWTVFNAFLGTVKKNNAVWHVDKKMLANLYWMNTPC